MVLFFFCLLWSGDGSSAALVQGTIHLRIDVHTSTQGRVAVSPHSPAFAKAVPCIGVLELKFYSFASHHRPCLLLLVLKCFAAYFNMLFLASTSALAAGVARSESQHVAVPTSRTSHSPRLRGFIPLKPPPCSCMQNAMGHDNVGLINCFMLMHSTLLVHTSLVLGGRGSGPRSRAVLLSPLPSLPPTLRQVV